MLRIKYEDMVKEFNRVLLGRGFPGKTRRQQQNCLHKTVWTEYTATG